MFFRLYKVHFTFLLLSRRTSKRLKRTNHWVILAKEQGKKGQGNFGQVENGNYDKGIIGQGKMVKEKNAKFLLK